LTKTLEVYRRREKATIEPSVNMAGQVR
jgi:hypothetical protein